MSCASAWSMALTPMHPVCIRTRSVLHRILKHPRHIPTPIRALACPLTYHGHHLAEMEHSTTIRTTRTSVSSLYHRCFWLPNEIIIMLARFYSSTVPMSTHVTSNTAAHYTWQHVYSMMYAISLSPIMLVSQYRTSMAIHHYHCGRQWKSCKSPLSNENSANYVVNLHRFRNAIVFYYVIITMINIKRSRRWWTVTLRIILSTV